MLCGFPKLTSCFGFITVSFEPTPSAYIGMVDPIGAVSLGITACQGIYSYYESYKSFGSDIDDITYTATILTLILGSLQQRLQEVKEKNIPLEGDIKPAVDAILRCQQSIQNLHNMLEECTKSSSRFQKAGSRILYPFHKNALNGLLKTMTDMGQILSMAHNNLNLWVLYYLTWLSSALLTI